MSEFRRQRQPRLCQLSGLYEADCVVLAQRPPIQQHQSRLALLCDQGNVRFLPVAALNDHAFSALRSREKTAETASLCVSSILKMGARTAC